ncbi:DUF721 domain-containing protein [Peteryoungia desertarenae]|uniref:DUF721 domain-containing protein n=1 Tax=Peteryoungia desertarenae TaxID=1813451 RepID=A0ABX6QM77_9HYPH|nr:DUF721 domain-containing protein [Peteryoungia desertarenae]QLF69701.1 DUF721 domain-containing protein [Peteryoungia desertarenae]
MAPPRKSAAQIAEIANGIVDPVLARRAGITTALLGSWDEIAGASFADCTRPEKITWPRRSDLPDEGGHRPGLLVIACEGARALFLSHAQGELIARINGFFGYPAIGQIRIVQKPVSNASLRPRRPRKLEGEKARRLEAMMEGIESDNLRRAIERLGTGVMSARRK